METKNWLRVTKIWYKVIKTWSRVTKKLLATRVKKKSLLLLKSPTTLQISTNQKVQASFNDVFQGMTASLDQSSTSSTGRPMGDPIGRL